MRDQRPPKWLHCQRLFLLLLSVFGAAAPLSAQVVSADPAFSEVPFEKWLAEGPHEDFPWKVHVSSAGLSNYQRLLARIEIEVPGKELAKRISQTRPIVLAQFTDRQGRSYQKHWALEWLEGEAAVNQWSAISSGNALVLPGEYDVAVALYDKASGEHNLARRTLLVPLSGKEPLPGAWRDLPGVEFFEAAKGLDRFFHPEIQGRLHLPLVTRRPVQIELLLNPAILERLGGSRKVYQQNLAALLPTLGVFTQIDLSNGSLGLTVLDLSRRRIGFEQKDARKLDWQALKAALTAADPGVVDAASLRDRKENAAFLRDELARRVEADCGAPPERADRPLHVYVVLGSPMTFDSLGHPSPIPRPKEGNCVAYYVRYEGMGTLFTVEEPISGRPSFQSSPPETVDHIEGILKPLNPHVFNVHSPEGVRNALAFIVDKTSQM